MWTSPRKRQKPRAADDLQQDIAHSPSRWPADPTHPGSPRRVAGPRSEAQPASRWRQAQQIALHGPRISDRESGCCWHRAHRRLGAEAGASPSPVGTQRLQNPMRHPRPCRSSSHVGAVVVISVEPVGHRRPSQGSMSMEHWQAEGGGVVRSVRKTAAGAVAAGDRCRWQHSRRSRLACVWGRDMGARRAETRP